MIDIHCHILPAADDGAANMENALRMARIAHKSGVDTIIATPHCNPDNFVSYELRDRFVALIKAVMQENIPLTILPGAEVLCTPNLPELLHEKKLLPLAGSKYLLVEFLFDESFSYMDDMLRVVTEHGLTPVIAHPERYSTIQRQPAVLEHWFSEGYVIQLNKDSILGELGHRAEAAADWALSHGLAHIAASDAHSPSVRNPRLAELRTYLTQVYSPQCAALLLERNPRQIINGLPVLPSR